MNSVHAIKEKKYDLCETSYNAHHPSLPFDIWIRFKFGTERNMNLVGFVFQLLHLYFEFRTFGIEIQFLEHLIGFSVGINMLTVVGTPWSVFV